MTSRPAAPPAAARPPTQPLAAPPPSSARAAPPPSSARAAPAQAAAPASSDKFIPPPLSKLEDTGLSLNYLSDLALKILYSSGYLTGFRIADLMTLPFIGIVDQILEFLKREKLVEVKGAGGFGEGAYQYAITGLGIERAREAMARNQYAGPAPVLIETYNSAVRRQAAKRIQVHQRTMRAALSHLVVSEKTFARIGPAANSGTSLFLYGAPGNGKTSIARSIGEMILGEDMYIPFAVDVDGQVIKVYDNVNHVEIKEEEVHTGNTGSLQASKLKRDTRWIKVKRPFVVVGGELTMAGLDLQFDDVNKFYEAPFQMKANGGMFLIDDFGRQQVRPRDLLNRWIVPLENRIDFLTLHTGRKITIPFEVLVVFSTNLPPKDLVDEAFLRRIRHKIEIVDPTFEEYREIFKRMAIAKKIAYDDKWLVYLLQEWYIKRNRKLRSNHPRDICEQIIDIASYLNLEPALTKELIDRACEGYFVEL
ncbi:MAG TPA: ATP-binding protein [Anaerolineales bacterium]|nr:ATP-binding protein [Anaerolineales bacterium]